MNNPYLWLGVVLFVSVVIVRVVYKYKKWQKAIEYKKELTELTRTLGIMNKRLFDLAKQRIRDIQSQELPNPNIGLGQVVVVNDALPFGNKLTTLMKIGANLDDLGIGLTQLQESDKRYKALLNKLSKIKADMSNHIADCDQLNKAITNAKLYSWGVNSFYIHTQSTLNDNTTPVRWRNSYRQFEQVINDMLDKHIERVRKTAIKSYLS